MLYKLILRADADVPEWSPTRWTIPTRPSACHLQASKAGGKLAVKPEIGNPANLVGSEIRACNGVVHIIDSVSAHTAILKSRCCGCQMLCSFCSPAVVSPAILQH